MKELKDINLITTALEYWKSRQIARLIMVGILLFFSIVLVSYFHIRTTYQETKTKNTQILEKIEILKDVDTVVKEVADSKAKIESFETKMKNISNDKVKVSEIMSKVLGIIPDYIYVSDISVSKDSTISATFIVKSPVEAVNLYDSLKRSNMFTNLQSASIPFVQGESEIKYTLQLKKS